MFSKMSKGWHEEAGIYLLIGRMKSGKSHFLQWLMSKKNGYFHAIVGFTQTKFAGSLNYIDSSMVYENFRPDIVGKMMEIQKKTKEQTGKCPPVALLLDDVLGDSELKMYGKLWEKLGAMCRHYNMFIYITSQYVKKIAPILRQNASCIVIAGMPTTVVLKDLFTEFASHVTQKEFDKIVSGAVANHGYLMVFPTGATKTDVFSIMRLPSTLTKFEYQTAR